MDRWTTPFGRWVQQTGVPELADALTKKGELVTTSAIYAWIAGRAVPQPAKASIILELAEGRLTWHDIYGQRKLVLAEEPLVQERLEEVSIAPAGKA